MRGQPRLGKCKLSRLAPHLPHQLIGILSPPGNPHCKRKRSAHFMRTLLCPLRHFCRARVAGYAAFLASVLTSTTLLAERPARRVAALRMFVSCLPNAELLPTAPRSRSMTLLNSG